jgi:hypothetical protein
MQNATMPGCRTEGVLGNRLATAMAPELPAIHRLFEPQPSEEFPSFRLVTGTDKLFHKSSPFSNPQPKRATLVRSKASRAQSVSGREKTEAEAYRIVERPVNPKRKANQETGRLGQQPDGGKRESLKRHRFAQ